MSHYTSPHSEPVLIGVIGGSGVYSMDFLQNAQYYDMNTPFGKPSDKVCVAYVNSMPCAFLPRHGSHHQYNPSEVNYRANVCAMKQLGVRYLLAINAVGSLDDNYQPGDLVVVSQMIDKTCMRQSTFFEKGIVAHVAFGDPTSTQFNRLVYETLTSCFPDSEPTCHATRQNGGFAVHASATMVTMEGPQFSTRAESLLNKKIGAHLIGMTGSTEARLAREAQMAYAMVAMVTDMDAWNEGPHVDVSTVIQVMKANTDKAQVYTKKIIKMVQSNMFDDPAHHALDYALMTSAEHVSEETKERLRPILADKFPAYIPK